MIAEAQLIQAGQDTVPGTQLIQTGQDTRDTAYRGRTGYGTRDMAHTGRTGYQENSSYRQYRIKGTSVVDPQAA